MIKLKRFICAFLCFSIILYTAGTVVFADDGEEDAYFSDEQIEYYYKVDTLKRLVSANKMSAVDASKELNTAFTKIRPR